MPKPHKNETSKDYISRCIPELIKEGKDQEQAAAICHSYWKEKMTTHKKSVGYDYDGVLSDLTYYRLKAYIDVIHEDNVYIITKRNDDINDLKHGSAEVYDTARSLRIPIENVYFTNNGIKSPLITELGIDEFYDDTQENVDEINKNTKCKAILVK